MVLLMITPIVRGERTDRIMRAGHDAPPVFGLLSNVDEKSIKGAHSTICSFWLFP